MNKSESRLEKFASQNKIRGKGPLSLVLVVTRKASEQTPPFAADNYLTPQGGQVAGLGRGAVQSILADHGIDRVLAEEGGRTSRGSILKMRAYVDFLNELAQEKLLDFDAIEKWWIGRVREFFNSKPFSLKVDSSKSIRSIVSDLIEAAFDRQRECPGVMVAGAVMQHLVGAKIATALPDVKIKHEGFSVADAPAGRKGDFLIGDTAIHVTTAPTEALIRKCCDNLAQNLRPMVITTQNGMGWGAALAKEANIADRFDILEIEQFVTANIYKWSAFQQTKRSLTVRRLVKTYNRIIDECETDPSLKIAMG